MRDPEEIDQLARENSQIITQLKNPCTQDYDEFKNHIYSPEMTWAYHEPMNFPGNTRELELPYYQHMIMKRPVEGEAYSAITSNLFEPAYSIIEELLLVNDIKLCTIYRIHINSTFNSENKKGPWHTDLPFAHKNLIVYMSRFEGGAIWVRYGPPGDEEEIRFVPKEDNAIIFDGKFEHCQEVPDDYGRRIALVVNYL